MKKRYVVLALALTVALCTALPAVGASPAQLAKKAFGLAKKANKRAKSADNRARSAQSAAGAAGAAANGAQATAESARSTASSAQSAAGAARTSARQVYRDGGQGLAPSAGPVTVASMYGVAPGAYVIMAKTDVFAGGTGAGIVQCQVSAGGTATSRTPAWATARTP
jgi:trimeric autotransporter adhesin